MLTTHASKPNLQSFSPLCQATCIYNFLCQACYINPRPKPCIRTRYNKHNKIFTSLPFFLLASDTYKHHSYTCPRPKPLQQSHLTFILLPNVRKLKPWAFDCFGWWCNRVLGKVGGRCVGLRCAREKWRVAFGVALWNQRPLALV